MSKLVKAREIEIPANMPEILDRRAGKSAGELRNLLAEAGKLHTLKDEMIHALLALEIKTIMETKVLPGKPMSLHRFSEMMWVLMLTYTMGTMKVSEDGQLEIGKVNDIGFVGDLLQADEFEFRGGTRVSAQKLLYIIQQLAKEENLESIYEDVVGKGIFKRSELTARNSLQLAELIMKSVSDFEKSENWS
jgi:hypothetical protein